MKSKKFEYFFAPKALDDLEEILNYIETGLCNPKAARDLAVNIFKQIDLACEFPEAGANINNEYISDQSLKKLIIGSYVLFYKIKESEKWLIIVRIIYGGRDMEQVFKKM